jgi:hypothetical protein
MRLRRQRGGAAGAAIALTVTSSADALQVRAIATVPDTMLRKQAVLWLGLIPTAVTSPRSLPAKIVVCDCTMITSCVHCTDPIRSTPTETAVAELLLVPQRDDGQSPVLVAFRAGFETWWTRCKRSNCRRAGSCRAVSTLQPQLKKPARGGLFLMQ